MAAPLPRTSGIADGPPPPAPYAVADSHRDRVFAFPPAARRRRSRSAPITYAVRGARTGPGRTRRYIRTLTKDRSMPRRWYKGNTHTHTTYSDGDSPPEVVVDWYGAL